MYKNEMEWNTENKILMKLYELEGRTNAWNVFRSSTTPQLSVLEQRPFVIDHAEAFCRAGIQTGQSRAGLCLLRNVFV